jgi:hypothetical protein
MRLKFATDPIPLDVQAGKAITIKHGMGSQVDGWLVIWQTAPIALWQTNPTQDTRNEITLTPSHTGSIRLVFLQ